MERLTFLSGRISASSEGDLSGIISLNNVGDQATSTFLIHPVHSDLYLITFPIK